MKTIVIKILDADYESIKRGMRYRDVVEDIMLQIEKSTPLPKGHGGLIDANRANDIAKETKTDKDERIIRNFLNTLPTIIEADGGAE